MHAQENIKQMTMAQVQESMRVLEQTKKVVADAKAVKKTANKVANKVAVPKGGVQGPVKCPTFKTRRTPATKRACKTQGTVGIPVEPTWEDIPVTQDSVTQDTVTQESVTQESVTQDTVTQESVTQESVTQGPVTQGPVTQGPVTQDPVIEQNIGEVFNEGCDMSFLTNGQSSEMSSSSQATNAGNNFLLGQAQVSAEQVAAMKMVEDANSYDFSVIDLSSKQRKRMSVLFSLDKYNTKPVEFERSGNWLQGIEPLVASTDLQPGGAWKYQRFDVLCNGPSNVAVVDSACVNMLQFDNVLREDFFTSPMARAECNSVVAGRSYTYRVDPHPAFAGDSRVMVNSISYNMKHFRDFMGKFTPDVDITRHPRLHEFLIKRANHPSEFFLLPLGEKNMLFPVPKRFILPVYCSEKGIVKCAREATYALGYILFTIQQRFVKDGVMSQDADYKRFFNLFCCMECFNKEKLFVFHSLDECRAHYAECKTFMGTGPMIVHPPRMSVLRVQPVCAAATASAATASAATASAATASAAAASAVPTASAQESMQQESMQEDDVERALDSIRSAASVSQQLADKHPKSVLRSIQSLISDSDMVDYSLESQNDRKRRYNISDRTFYRIDPYPEQPFAEELWFHLNDVGHIKW